MLWLFSLKTRKSPMKKLSLSILAVFAACLFNTMPLSAQEAPKPIIVKAAPPTAAPATNTAPATTVAPPAAAPVMTTGPATIIPDIVIVPASSVPLASMQKAVKEAAIRRDWIPKVLSDNTIRCDLSVRGKHRVIIDVILATDKIIFRYVSSENMNYDPVKKKIHRKYEGWVKILGQEINKSLVMMGAE